MGSSKADRYWKQFLDSLPSNQSHPERYFEVFNFGGDTYAQHAQKIGQLVLDGIKTSSGDVRWAREADGNPTPKRGDLSIFTDENGDPMGIIETTEVRVVPFNEVDAGFAYEGGESDRSLKGWRKMYWEYIVSECDRIGREPSPDIPMICERFRLVYSAPLRTDS